MDGGHEADVEMSMSEEYDGERAKNSIENLMDKMNISGINGFDSARQYNRETCWNDSINSVRERKDDQGQPVPDSANMLKEYQQSFGPCPAQNPFAGATSQELVFGAKQQQNRPFPGLNQ